MGNITVTLLTSKRTRQTINALDSVVAAQAGGYVVVEGEHRATTIVVNYPEAYAGKNCYVYMKNSKGEYDTVNLGAGTQKSFTLPDTMTYVGNTTLVFYAADANTRTAWLPVIVPVAETGVDYHKVTTVTEDTLREILQTTSEAVEICRGIEERADNGEFNGQSVFIRYSANADGSDMSETWQPGQRYLGTFIGTEASSTPSDYTWLLFVGDAFCTEDGSAGAVRATVAAYTDVTYTSGDIESLTVVIPNGVQHGFYAGLNFRTGSRTVPVSFTNFSTKPLKIIVSGTATDGYAPAQNSMVRMIFDCDGVNVYCTIVEV